MLIRCSNGSITEFCQCYNKLLTECIKIPTTVIRPTKPTTVACVPERFASVIAWFITGTSATPTTIPIIAETNP